MALLTFQKLARTWKFWGACTLLIFLVNLLYLLSQLSYSSKLVGPTKKPSRQFELKRGADPIHKINKLSNTSETFTCMDNSKKILISEVNDDYCDCPDASDEPGTNACNNGRFFCHVEQKYLPSSYVNDGICDCCDGSDEWNIVAADLGFILPVKYPSKRFVPCSVTCGD